MRMTIGLPAVATGTTQPGAKRHSSDAAPAVCASGSWCGAARVRPTAERFLEKCDRDGEECWAWLGARMGNGYGSFWLDGKAQTAHRAAYLIFVGPIPSGRYHVDHLCRNRLCVNPAHLEVVTEKTNILRGVGPSAQAARKSECAKGHPFDLLNTIWNANGRRRYCRTCTTANRARRYQREQFEAGGKEAT